MLSNWFAQNGWAEIVWLTIGFMAQAMFSARFLVQWIASERVRKSIVPEAFWYFSAAGGAMLLAYAIYRQDPVFILGQAFGLVVYARNIYFIWTERRAGEPGHEG
ncbi:MAG: lipid-A-disaccharide synthase N-terminal domain-containing protein [Limimaricola soesokkakensis]|uniref:Lipid-A-disaccharide synthase n=1 Tax=Limimaricola soesokkakensis TaxID=1343159 RepID=A0A1X6ZGE1_9RHOB|nr:MULTISPECIES: lipid-A-disaccharide synthase N-terminal domain-containing protein [Limimaricola]MCZ4260226.1 lipid-A-disaccharide synthase N-terminal domain-containing protein [Limimaricola sp. G21655-S1]PSK86091.1 lipid-A-disaccharide synthase-like uncharacterized protein [Limimaricola soesokkakensis]SLN50599.1 lipid-A-disaccharide synthase [Limimaricola soesokkakensis]